MSDNISLIVAMADKCRELILASREAGIGQPPSLQPKHLEWMCQQVAMHADAWPATRVHRWVGFVQAAMIANRMIDLHDAQEMFDRAKSDFGTPDDDLLDHLDPRSSFQIEIGGQG